MVDVDEGRLNELLEKVGQLEKENAQLREGGSDPDAPTTLLGAQRAEGSRVQSLDAREPASDDATGTGFLLNADGGLTRVAVRVQTGTDDAGNPTFETRLGRFRVSRTGRLSIEYPQAAEEGEKR